MSIKKERRLFNKNTDLETESTYQDFELSCDRKFDVRYMSSTKMTHSAPIQYLRFINDYEVKEVIGTGCFSTVYKCLNKFDNMVYAIAIKAD